MIRREKSFRDSNGNRIERDQPVCTITGIILYKGKGNDWKINYPDMKQYGSVNTIKLINLIYYLGRGRNLYEARELSGLLNP